MRERHDLHIGAEATSAISYLFVAGPFGALAAGGAIAIACLLLLALSEPGKAFAGACVVVLPIVAFIVAWPRSDGAPIGKGRIVACVGLLLGAVFAYQLQWGAVSERIYESEESRCSYPSTNDAAQFVSCRSHFTKQEIANACGYLMKNDETRTLRVRLTCSFN